MFVRMPALLVAVAAVLLLPHTCFTLPVRAWPFEDFAKCASHCCTVMKCGGDDNCTVKTTVNVNTVGAAGPGPTTVSKWLVTDKLRTQGCKAFATGFRVQYQNASLQQSGTKLGMGCCTACIEDCHAAHDCQFHTCRADEHCVALGTHTSPALTHGCVPKAVDACLIQEPAATACADDGHENIFDAAVCKRAADIDDESKNKLGPELSWLGESALSGAHIPAGCSYHSLPQTTSLNPNGKGLNCSIHAFSGCKCQTKGCVPTGGRFWEKTKGDCITSTTDQHPDADSAVEHTFGNYSDDTSDTGQHAALVEAQRACETNAHCAGYHTQLHASGSLKTIELRMPCTLAKDVPVGCNATTCSLEQKGETYFKPTTNCTYAYPNMFFDGRVYEGTGSTEEEKYCSTLLKRCGASVFCTASGKPAELCKAECAAAAKPTDPPATTTRVKKKQPMVLPTTTNATTTNDAFKLLTAQNPSTTPTGATTSNAVTGVDFRLNLPPGYANNTANRSPPGDSTGDESGGATPIVIALVVVAVVRPPFETRSTQYSPPHFLFYWASMGIACVSETRCAPVNSTMLWLVWGLRNLAACPPFTHGQLLVVVLGTGGSRTVGRCSVAQEEDEQDGRTRRAGGRHSGE